MGDLVGDLGVFGLPIGPPKILDIDGELGRSSEHTPKTTDPSSFVFVRYPHSDVFDPRLGDDFLLVTGADVPVSSMEPHTIILPP